MNKEIFAALLIGLAIGALVFGGVWTANQALQNSSGSLLSPNSTEQNSPQANSASKEMPLTIVTPADLTVTPGKISVEGKTLPNTHLVIQTDSDAFYLETQDNGNYTQDVTLTPGSNDITVTAIDDAGDSTSKTVTVVYSSAI